MKKKKQKQYARAFLLPLSFLETEDFCTARLGNEQVTSYNFFQALGCKINLRNDF